MRKASPRCKAGEGTPLRALFPGAAGEGKSDLENLPGTTGREIFPTTAANTRERVRRVIARMKTRAAEKAGQASSLLPGLEAQAGSLCCPPDLGFKVFNLAESNFAIWNPALKASEEGESG